MEICRFNMLLTFPSAHPRVGGDPESRELHFAILDPRLRGDERGREYVKPKLSAHPVEKRGPSPRLSTLPVFPVMDPDFRRDERV